MLKHLPHFAKLAVNATVILASTLLLFPLLMLTALIRLLVPSAFLKQWSKVKLVQIAERWISNNNALFDATLGTEFVINGLDNAALNLQQSSFLTANHQSWADILILQKIFNRQLPFFRFFLKQELLWVPIMGICWHALDYPFMKRYSKEKLAKHPELKGQDKQTTLDRCNKLQGYPVTIVSFLEGTRFTAAKHVQQQSSYTHLLKPKSAGFSYTLNVLQQLDTLVDVTILYPYGVPTFADFMAGKCPKGVIDIWTHPISEAFRRGDYENDPAFKAQFQSWVSDIWTQKNQRLDLLIAEHSKQ